MQSETAERRASFRERTMLGGLIATNSESSMINCTVRNLTRSGAAVEFPTTASMPQRFKLAIAKNGRAHTAKIVWFRDNRAGLEFDAQEGTASNADHNPDLETRLRISERKARALQRRVLELSGG